MKRILSLSFLIVLFLNAGVATAQTDTAFWFAAPEISQSFGNFDQPIVFRISGLGQAASVTLTVPASTTFTPITVTVPANGIATIDVTPWIDLVEAKPANTVLNNGLKLSATAPVNVYYEDISGLNAACQCNPEIFVLKGKNALGTNFLVPSQNLLQNGTAYSPPALNSFDIVATENGTSVTITPKAAIVGHAAGVPFTITLNRGQVFSCTATGYLPFSHLTGSLVTSTKPVAITVKDDLVQGPACWDLGGDQIIPIDNLSTEYIGVRGYLTSLTDQVFVSAISNGTTVSVNGSLLTTLNAGQTVAVPFTTEAMYIQSNNKVYAFQLSGFGCEIGLSTLPSNVCRGSNTVSFARSSNADLILLISTRNGNQNGFQLNGTALTGATFNPVPGTSNQWVYARVTIPVSQIPALGAGILTNNAGRFHLGIIHGSTTSGGARFGYFSDFAAPVLNVLADRLEVCADSVVLNGGIGYASYNWNNGATTPAITALQNGLYKVTVTTSEGCTLSDSGYVKLNKLVRSDSTLRTICTGQSYALPWGTVVTAPGLYRDTLRYQSGCDSVRSTVNVNVLATSLQTVSAAICERQNYTLPWGQVVTAAGIYRDTLRANGGCDSLIRIVQLTNRSSTASAITIRLCQGQSYTLPSGQIVSTPGVYRDTIRYSNTSCDSLVHVATVLLQTSSLSTFNASFCSGHNYVLPWGSTVSSAGIYTDTLRYSNGCDSVIRQVNLTEKTVNRLTTSATFCEGRSYILPWGKTVTTGGVYRDTLRYISGCDSIVSAVTLLSVKPVYDSVQKYICPGQAIALPSGATVRLPGIYRDTLRSRLGGCDSIITHFTLTPGIPPEITLTKSNDISCGSGVSRLIATGGSRYEWSPVSSLSNAYIANPVASPVITTFYRVKVTTADGCFAVDSIGVNVKLTSASGGFLVPSAFTPNNDGKNDCFGVSNWGLVRNFQLTIYNRWGDVVFETSDVSRCWDGFYKGSLQSTAAFIYVISAETDCGKVFRKGTFTLIR